MTTMQDKFFRELQHAVQAENRQGRVARSKAEIATRAAWGNTGMAVLQPVDSFDVLSTLQYGFYDDYATFTVNGTKFYVSYVPEPNRATFPMVIAAFVRPMREELV